ncbi:HK97 gp10 family phage protein [Halalkalibacterium halodurans]|uniref:HK97 gp10 family phage protein n=1 Tax=Halalkalibacterium halodurans TaxID=86665 RepID=UPI002E1F1FC4|nr:HK97 gp10 family phage protein [Halalkalibacterium halodurans]
MSLEINDKELQELVPKMRRALQTAHNLKAQDLWGNLMQESPQNHGYLAGSWSLQQRGDLLSAISTHVVYALVQNDGSDPYEIVPKNASALRFEVNGQTVFSKRVQHPGIKGKQYIERSIEMTENRLEDFVAIGLAREGL